MNWTGSVTQPALLVLDKKMLVENVFCALSPHLSDSFDICRLMVPRFVFSLACCSSRFSPLGFLHFIVTSLDLSDFCRSISIRIDQTSYCVCHQRTPLILSVCHVHCSKRTDLVSCYLFSVSPSSVICPSFCPFACPSVTNIVCHMSIFLSACLSVCH